MNGQPLDNRLLDECPNGGGTRIFSEHKTYDDTADYRDKVTVKATIYPPRSDVVVYFKSWDIDDPSDDIVIDPNGPEGEDNKGTPKEGTLSPTSAVTDSSGVASVTLAVSLFPGDNHVVAASCNLEILAAMTLAQANAGQPPPGVEQTGRLVVWRVLRLELDSMAAGQDNPVTDKNIDAAVWNTPHAGETACEMCGWDVIDDGRYEGGTMTVTGGGTYTPIVDSIALGWGQDDDCVVSGDASAEEDRKASMVDDDGSELARKVNWSLMPAKFKPAYVSVVEEEGVSQLDATFTPNLGIELEALNAVAEPKRNRLTRRNYWMVQILSCHQGVRANDGDPDLYYHFHSMENKKQGDTAWLYGQTPGPPKPGYGNVTGIHLETIRDAAAQYVWWKDHGIPERGFWDAQIEKTNVVHEVGHAFGCCHADGGIMENGAEDPALNFTSNSIRAIRFRDEIDDE